MDLEASFRQYVAKEPALRVRAPGRVNLLGEHVDYNDGPVLPAAIDRAVRLAASPAEDGIVRLHALDLKQKTAFHLEAVESRVDLEGRPLPSWALYPAGVAWALKEANLEV
ncbi:MAG TPA: galactokinase family protein, partial [Anaerolineales bacterium]